MNAEKCQQTVPSSTFLRRLKADVSGNALSVMAAFLFPALALAGASVDISRQYVLKTRLQQACDAGVLAGRKVLTAATGSTLDTAALVQANAFFTSNFPSGWMASTNVEFLPVRTSDGQVNATATATIPMTVMKIFGNNSAKLTVACTARLDVADTDVMFVLDTTGSMADPTSGSCTGTNAGDIVTYVRPTYTRPTTPPSPISGAEGYSGTTAYRKVECNGSKMAGIRIAVMDFYTTLKNNSSVGTKIRYGFVNYSSAVNVGYLLPSNHIVDTWNYQSRRLPTTGFEANLGLPVDEAPIANVTSAYCDSLAVRLPATGFTTFGAADVRTVKSWIQVGSTGRGTCTIRRQTKKPNWQYTSVSLDVSQFKTGATVTDPTKITGATSKWSGCIEERDTTAVTTFDISSLPADLNPDTPATSDATRWRPMWQDVIYYRGNSTSVNHSGDSPGPYGNTTTTSSTGDYTNLASSQNLQDFYVACGKPAQRLAEMTSTQVSNYINATDFVPFGSTYHDTGMIWGTRLISPTGIFAADTAAWPGRTEPNRYIVFMTDGEPFNRRSDYGLYGMERYDQRVGGSTDGDLETRRTARFEAACGAAKARGIEVYAISFGTPLTASLTNCASSGNAYFAGTNTALAGIFEQIAKDIAALRLSQ